MLAGEVALARGQPSDAVALLRLAVTFDSTADIVESFARALAANGDLKGAAKLYESIAANRRAN